MLRAHAVSSALTRIASGIASAECGCTALLLASDGRLLAQSAGDGALAAEESRLAGCIAARAFAEYAAAAAGLERHADVDFLWLACEYGVIAAAPVNEALLLACVCGGGAQLEPTRLQVDAARRALAPALESLGVLSAASAAVAAAAPAGAGAGVGAAGRAAGGASSIVAGLPLLYH